MSIHPLLLPDSVNNESLNIYCHNITTNQNNSGFTTLHDHQNLSMYVGTNSLNGGVQLLSDLKQLVNYTNKCVEITGKMNIRITIGGYNTLILVFTKPPSVIDKIIDGTTIYVKGSGMYGATLDASYTLGQATPIIIGSETGFSLNFQTSDHSLITNVPHNITIGYSITYKTV